MDTPAKASYSKLHETSYYLKIKNEVENLTRNFFRLTFLKNKRILNPVKSLWYIKRHSSIGTRYVKSPCNFISCNSQIRILYNKLLSGNYWFWKLHIFGKLLQLKKEGSSIMFLEIWANLSESDIELFRCVQGGEEGNQFT